MEIESFYFDEEKNQIVVIIREPSNMILTCNPPRRAPDHIEKRIYGVVNGKIDLQKIIIGKHVPSEVVHEQFIFNEEVKGES